VQLFRAAETATRSGCQHERCGHPQTLQPRRAPVVRCAA
jgi:hypothetical protein